jgi:tetratricopeptide (TPR) repeat protein
MTRAARILFICFLWSFELSGQLRLPKEINVLVLEGVDLILKQEYERADSVFTTVSSKYPHHPIGYLYKAAVLQARSIDYLDPIDFAVFDSLLSIGSSEAEEMRYETPDSPLGYYYLGTATGYSAYARVEAGSWFAGITKGLSAASDFKRAVELDSSLYDAYVGVGTYYYWKSRKADFLNWALGDRRPEGIMLLETATIKAELNKHAAISALSAIYLDAKQFDLAIECANRGLEQYPDNRVFLWSLAAAQEQSGKYADALRTYRFLLQNILRARIKNPYNEMLCRLNLVKAMMAINQTEGVETHLEAILSFEDYRFPDNLRDRAANKFEQARNIRAQLVVK